MKNKRERENLTKLHFEETVRINTEGRYEVLLPWKENPFPIPSNKEIAMKRLESSTKKLHHETLFKAYDDAYEGMGIISHCFSPVISGQHDLSIHAFCDANQFAYAAAVFVRMEYSDVAHINLLAAKSRIAPIKTITIPCLELLAATVEARLCRSVLSALEWDNVKQHYRTDSTTVLSWIQREELWSVFVNNRVQEIRELTDPTSWKHFSGALNPADLPSSGCSAHQLLCSRWWEGPKWLLQTEEN
ncbi:integrase catalytic domain-containing protein [Trichonephila clavipes]|nr:integrase catalytic domain-containing protein [Trichonephila clavipes]